MNTSDIEVCLDRNPDNLHLLRQWLRHQTDERKRMAKGSKRNPDRYAAEGLRLHQAGRLQEALWHYRVCLAVAPKRAEVWSNLGVLYRQNGHLEAGVICYHKALGCDPGLVNARVNLGDCLHQLGRLDEATSHLLQVVRQNPQEAQAWTNLAAVQNELGCSVAGAASARKAIQLKADDFRSWTNLANALSNIGDVEAARQAYAEALHLAPDRQDIWSNYLFVINNHPNLTAADRRAVAADWASRLCSPHAPPSAEARTQHLRTGALRLGVIGGDFRHHAISYFLLPLLQSLKSQGAVVFIYAHQCGSDELTTVYQQLATGWHWIHPMSDEQVAQLIRADKLDILLDVAGHSSNNRLGVLAYKPAPVQVSHPMGFGSTTGLAMVDYFLSCPALLARPAGVSPDRFWYPHSDFSEQIWECPLPPFLFQPDSRPYSTELPLQRNGYVTFGCFSRPIRFSPALLKSWAALLTALPTAQLVINAKFLGEQEAQKLLRERFAASGVPVERVRLCCESPPWRMYTEEIDIALDTFPHNAGTTTFDALWQGCPVISLAGACLHERFGAMILSALGLDDLLAYNADDYVARAITLADNQEKLQQLRSTLRQRIEHSVFQDTAAIGSALMQAFRGMRPTKPTSEVAISIERLFRQALQHQTEGRYDAAAKGYQELLQTQPDHAAALSNLGMIYRVTGQPLLAEQTYRRALQADPHQADAASNLGNLLMQQGRFAEAESAARTCVTANSKHAMGWTILSGACASLNRPEEALAAADAALRLSPTMAEARNNRGRALAMLGRLHEAVADYRAALALNPDTRVAADNLLLELCYLEGVSAAEVALEHRRFGERLEPGIQPDTPRTPVLADWGRPLRVGYVSSDLRNHAVAYFAAPLLQHHDRNRVQVVVFNNSGAPDRITDQFRAWADAWVDIAGLTDEQVAEQVWRLQIDLLVDMTGHTDKNRLSLFARRPAPVQLTWLGHPHSSGLSRMDWRLTDGVADPEGFDTQYTEKLWRLPSVFCCYRPAIKYPQGEVAARYPVQPAPVLANGFITFGSLNNYKKLQPCVVALWARVLQAVPGSRLLLEAVGFDTQTLRDHALNRFAEYGITPERLLLENRDSALQYLRYNAIDICLDPFPCNGGTTTADALWMGVPVVTLPQDRFAGRMGASLLTAIGHPEWIAADSEDYIRIAARLAADPMRLDAIRQGLRSAMAASPLMDEAGFARAVEDAFHGMWQRWCTPLFQRAEAYRTDGAEANLQQGVAALQCGNLQDAEGRFLAVVAGHPHHPAGWEGLGLVRQQQGAAGEALLCMQRAIERVPLAASPWQRLSELQEATGDVAGAAQSAFQAAQRLPQQRDSWVRLVRLVTGEPALCSATIAPLLRYCEKQPQAAEAWHALGVLALQANDLALAERGLSEALRCLPEEPTFSNNLGLCLRRRGKLDEAEAIFNRLRLQKPDMVSAWQNGAVVCFDQGRYETAAELLQHALLLDPNHYESLLMSGNTAVKLGRLAAAEAAYRKALELRPSSAEAWNNLGALCRDTDRLALADDCYTRALGIDPRFADAATNRAFACSQRCDLPMEEVVAVHRDFGNRFEPQLQVMRQPFTNLPDPERPLRLGIVTADLRSHSVMYFLEPLVERIDRNQFTLVAYLNQSISDDVTRRVLPCFSSFVVAKGLTDAELADRIRTDGIDLLLELSGHTGGNRLLALAHQPAPVQITWLGYPNTTGLQSVDWRITDAVADPAGVEAHYTERLWRLQRSFCVYRPCLREPARRWAPELAVRPAPALERGYVTFGSCNALSKLTPRTVALWAQVLQAVPAARLVVEAPGLQDESVFHRVADRFAAAGISGEQLVLQTRDTARQYLIYHEIDICLDPVPLNGGTTSFDLLWMGVPLVTLAGDRFAARMGATLLTHLGRPEWIAATEEEYVRIAAELAGDIQRLNELRLAQRHRMEASPLMDEAGFVAEFGEALRDMWRQWCEKKTGTDAASRAAGVSVTGGAGRPA